MINSFTILLYTAATGTQYWAMIRPLPRAKAVLLGLGGVAVSMHALMLTHWIEVGGGQNLTSMNLFSMAMWMMSVLMILFALRKPLENLSLFVFPLSALSLLFAMLIPGEHVLATGGDIRQLVHILLSVLSFSVLVMATLQALLVVLQQQGLRHLQQYGLWRKLPPLETMESMLFQLIMLGFLLLTILMITSFYFYHAVLWQRFLQKSIFASAAWMMFAGLLLGRQYFGWRGKKTIYFTLSGVGLLVLTYVSSWMIIGYMS